jgi:hypothetical protein
MTQVLEEVGFETLFARVPRPAGVEELPSRTFSGTPDLAIRRTVEAGTGELATSLIGRVTGSEYMEHTRATSDGPVTIRLLIATVQPRLADRWLSSVVSGVTIDDKTQGVPSAFRYRVMTPTELALAAVNSPIGLPSGTAMHSAVYWYGLRLILLKPGQSVSDLAGIFPDIQGIEYTAPSRRRRWSIRS